MDWQNNNAYNQQYNGYPNQSGHQNYSPRFPQRSYQQHQQQQLHPPPQQQYQQRPQQQQQYHQNYNVGFQQNDYQSRGGYNSQHPHQNHQYGHHNFQQRNRGGGNTYKERNRNQRQVSNSQNKSQGCSVGTLRCEPCERDFTSNSALQAHQKQHIKCEVESCSYFASSKAVKLHYIQTHAEGKFRICLQTPEEIQKWREERKRNWPTTDNMTRKKQKKADDERDGIIIETKEFTYPERRSERGRGRGRNRGRGRGGKGRHQNNNKPCNGTTTTNDNINPQKDVVEDTVTTNEMKTNEDRPVVNPPLDGKTDDVMKTTAASSSGLSLLQSYTPDVSDDENEVNNNTISNKEISLNTSPTNDKQEDKQTVNKEEEKEDGEIENNKETIIIPSPTAEDNKSHVSNEQGNKKRNGNRTRNRNSKQQQQNRNNHMEKRKATLLEMEKSTSQDVDVKNQLLANEIRHERNVTLQCIRYIVKEKFFDASR